MPHARLAPAKSLAPGQMILHDLDEIADVVALVQTSELGHHGLPGDGGRSSLDYPLHAALVRIDACAARRVGERVDLVSVLEKVKCRIRGLLPSRARR